MKFSQQLLGLFEKHKVALLMSFLLAVVLLIIAALEESLLKTAIYLTAVFASFLLSEFIYFVSDPSIKNWPIQKPKQELWIILFAVCISTLLMVSRFRIIDYSTATQAMKIFLQIMRLLFVLPVFLLIYFLGVRRYTLKAIGLWNFKYWFVCIPIIVMIGGASYLLFPDGMQFTSQWQSRGVIGMLALGFLTAAIPEEITRTLFQSRLGVFLSNKDIAWFTVSLIWALQHIPTFVFSSDVDFYGAIISALGILPIGLLWGYLNERYKSIIPSVILHGTNLWGLHNIF